MDKNKTVVIFRADKSGSHKGEVTAFFPQIPYDDHSGLVTCYAHSGQHGAASRQWYSETRPAKPAEYRELAKELRALGYRLDIRKRWPVTKFCRDLRHGTPCPLPCRVCAEECGK